MEITFEWSVMPRGLRVRRVNGNEDTVVNVTYKITASDGAATVDMVQSVQLELATSGEFTPFDQLTEQQVLDWARAATPSELVEQYEAVLTERLARRVSAPPIAIPKAAPWQTCSQV